MAYTYTTLKAAIESYLQQYDDDFVANLPEIIRQAEDRLIKATNLPVFKVNKTSTMTAASRFLSAPSDMLSAFALTVIDGSGNYIPLIFRNSSLIYEMYGGTASGLPVYYSLYNDTTFLLGPAPDANYGVEFQYFYRPTSITTSVDGTSWLGNNAENALLYACLLEAYIYMKGDKDVMAFYKDSYDQAVAALRRLGEGLSEQDTYTDNGPSVPVEKKS